MCEQMETVLHHIAAREKFHLPDEAAQAIVADSNGNMRKAVLVFEALKMQSSTSASEPDDPSISERRRRTPVHSASPQGTSPSLHW